MTDEHTGKTPPEPEPLGPDALKALDPHAAPEGPKPPPKPSAPKELFSKGLAYKWFDYILYQFERVCVVLGLGLMAMISFTTTVNENMTGQHQHLSVRVGAIVLAILGGLSAPKLKKYSLGVRFGAGVGAAAAMVGYSMLVATQTTHVTYYTLLGLAIVGAGVAFVMSPDDAEVKRERRTMLISVVLASVPIAGFVSTMPEKYSDSLKHTGLLLFWVGFLGASMAVYHRSHLQIDFLRKKFKGAKLHYYNAASNIATLFFTVLLFILTYNYIFGPTGNYFQDTAQGVLPDWSKVMAIAFSLAVMSMRFIAHIIEDLVHAIGGPSEAPAPAVAASTGEE